MGVVAFGRAVLRFIGSGSPDSTDVVPSSLVGNTASAIGITKIEFADDYRFNTQVSWQLHREYARGYGCVLPLP